MPGAELTRSWSSPAGVSTGAVLVGDTQDALWYLELIRGRAPIASLRDDMMFGRPLATRSEAA